MKKIFEILFLPIIGIGAVCCVCAGVYFSGKTYITVNTENNIKFGVCATVGVVCLIISLFVFNKSGSENDGSSKSD